MKNIRVTLRNCYGIGDLEAQFDFSDGRPYSVYASNGQMKTSFAKALMDLSAGQDSRDILFPDRVTLRHVVDESGHDVAPANVFVIPPYADDYSPERVSLLLVNADLKRKHDDAIRDVESQKDALVKTLRRPSGLSGRNVTPETELLAAFEARDLFSLIEEVAPAVAVHQTAWANLQYSELFNEKTVALLQSGDISTQLSEYLATYQQLVSESPILRTNFNHFHAASVQKALADNNFFAAKHSVRLFNGATQENIQTPEELLERFETEKRRVLTDSRIEKQFQAIDRRLSNVELRKFRDYLRQHQEVLPELADFREFRRRLWLGYLAAEKTQFDLFLAAVRSARDVVRDVTAQAVAERTDWEAVVNLFNQRFSVPFVLRVENQAEVILKGVAPTIAFRFQDSDGSVEVGDRGELLKVLSLGERRALYLLNILFELRVRQRLAVETLLVVDDIADSFDYRNKYAIIEYLSDLARDRKFRIIFLTHNYDFHRTVGMRVIGANRKHRLLAHKSGRSITLVEEKYQKSPFLGWRTSLDRDEILIACIPFVRNLAEYCGREADAERLTSLLHVKADSDTIKVGDLLSLFRSIVTGCSPGSRADHDRPVSELLQTTATALAADVSEFPNLEQKIVLAIATRLQAERYILDKIADPTFAAEITANQTAQLVSEFKRRFPMEVGAIRVLDQVSLMTPENIHLNAFMFEPLLDMSADNLRRAYKDVLAL